MVETSETFATLAAQLVKAQARVQNAIKDSKNPHFGSTFASLNSVLDAVKPVYAEFDLAVVQMPGMDDGNATLDTMVMHSSGEWIRWTAAAPLPKRDPQGVGSALTYLRRYALAAFAGIGQEDDDGNAGSMRPGELEALVREVREMLEHSNGNLPESGRLAAQQAVDNRDAHRLQKARAWLIEQKKETAA